MSPNDADAILLHDASLTAFRILAGGRLTLRFDGVTVYRREAPNRYNTWVHRASLILGDVTNVSVRGSWTRGDDDYVLDETIISRSGEEVEWVAIGKEGVRRIELLIFSGARIEIDCSKAELKLSPKGELTGSWEGPLRG